MQVAPWLATWPGIFLTFVVSGFMFGDAVRDLLDPYLRGAVGRWNCLEAEMIQSQADPVIDEIREARHRISARVDHEPARLVAYYIELQKRYRDRLSRQ